MQCTMTAARTRTATCRGSALKTQRRGTCNAASVPSTGCAILSPTKIISILGCKCHDGAIESFASSSPAGVGTRRADRQRRRFRAVDHRRHHLLPDQQGNPGEIRAAGGTDLQGDQAAGAHGDRQRLRRGARRPRQAGIRPRLHPSGAGRARRDQVGKVQVDRLDHRLYRLLGHAARQQGSAVHEARRPARPHHREPGSRTRSRRGCSARCCATRSSSRART